MDIVIDAARKTSQLKRKGDPISRHLSFEVPVFTLFASIPIAFQGCQSISCRSSNSWHRHLSGPGSSYIYPAAPASISV